MIIEPGKLGGVIAAMPSKSELHRLLAVAALSSSNVYLQGDFTCISQDIAATVNALKALGAKFVFEGNGLKITPVSKEIPENTVVSCGESGTTLRFLLPIIAAMGAVKSEVKLTGQGRLPERPIKELVEQLRVHGMKISRNSLPLSLSGKLSPGKYELPGNVSSQYISGLLLALPLLNGDSSLILTTPLEACAYVDITIDTLRKFGISIQKTAAGWEIPGSQHYACSTTLTAGGDWSNAAVWLAAGALGKPVTVTGLQLYSPQGDKKILELLSAFGAIVSSSGEAATVSPAPLHGIVLDVRDIPDLMPVLAILAAAAEGTTVFHGAARLRLKESDRLHETAELLAALGAKAEEEKDKLTVYGGVPLCGGKCTLPEDHRLAMAAALASVVSRKSIIISNEKSVEKSYPGFWDDFRKIGGRYVV